jgi:hypothetical protein
MNQIIRWLLNALDRVAWYFQTIRLNADPDGIFVRFISEVTWCFMLIPDKAIELSDIE